MIATQAPVGQTPRTFPTGLHGGRSQGPVLQPLHQPPGSGPRLGTHASPLLCRMCLKSQLIDLKAEGYWEELLDKFRPDIVVKDW